MQEFIQEKWLNLGKNGEPCGILRRELPFPSYMVSFKINGLPIMVAVKTSSLTATGEGKTGLELPKQQQPKAWSLTDL